MLRCIAKLCASLVVMATCASALAQDYPNKPVKLLVPFAAGGPADVYARFLGQRLQDAMGQPFVVENRPGGGAVLGTEIAAKSAPDGYTLLVMSNTHTVNESLLPNRPYQLMRDFTPVAPINYSDLMLVVNPSVRANTLREFIALAKAKGAYKGRRKALRPHEAVQLREMASAGMPKAELARTFQISRETVYAYLKAA